MKNALNNEPLDKDNVPMEEYANETINWQIPKLTHRLINTLTN